MTIVWEEKCMSCVCVCVCVSVCVCVCVCVYGHRLTLRINHSVKKRMHAMCVYAFAAQRRSYVQSEGGGTFRSDRHLNRGHRPERTLCAAHQFLSMAFAHWPLVIDKFYFYFLFSVQCWIPTFVHCPVFISDLCSLCSRPCLFLDECYITTFAHCPVFINDLCSLCSRPCHSWMSDKHASIVTLPTKTKGRQSSCTVQIRYRATRRSKSL